MTSGTIAFGWDQAASVLQGWRDVTASADDALDVMFGAMSTPAGRVLFTVPTRAGGPDEAAAQIARVQMLGEPVLDDVGQRALADTFLRSAEAMPPSCALYVHHSHGAATRVPATETAYPYRDDHLVAEIPGHWTDGNGTTEQARPRHRALPGPARPARRLGQPHDSR